MSCRLTEAYPWAHLGGTSDSGLGFMVWGEGSQDQHTQCSRSGRELSYRRVSREASRLTRISEPLWLTVARTWHKRNAKGKGQWKGS